MINWPRKGNDIYLNVVELTREERKKELKKAKQRTLGFVYYIQTELGFRHLGLADDEFPTDDMLALVPYHREGRRLRGMERLTINNILDIYKGKPLYRTGISVGDYPVDHHHNANPDAPPVSFPPVPSFNIPIGALIPDKIDGLIVSDKAISVSNIMNGSTRLQPVVLLTGQAAGVIAALSVKNNIKAREVNIRQVQQTLLDAGAYLMPLFDVNPDDRDFQTIQRVTSSGILRVKGEPYSWANRTWFNPDNVITVKEFSEDLKAYEISLSIIDDETILTVEKASELLSGVLNRNAMNEIQYILTEKSGITFSSGNPITKRDLAVITDRLLVPFKSKGIGFDGSYR
jgi:predicted amino acid-binding ACT domain protein